MADIFFISDTHFFHTNILKFLDNEGNRTRPFDSLSEMHEYIVKKWNSVVTPQDKVYHLGDVTFQYHPKFGELMKRLNGKKRLLLGNHDKIKGTNLMDWFQKVELWRPFPEYNFICSHIPIRDGQFRKAEFNVHGHVHLRSLEDPKYINVSCEVIDYTPVSLEDIRKCTGK